MPRPHTGRKYHIRGDIPDEMRLGALITGAIALALLVAAFLLVRRFARAMLRTRERHTGKTPALYGLEGVAFETASAEGRVRGWLLRAGDAPAPTIVVAHGWLATAGDMLGWAAPLVLAGHHVVVYDALGHGESDPSEFTSIRHMRQDLAAVLAWSAALPLAAPGIVVLGHSMGGAAAILLAARGPFPARALVTAGAPTDPLAITREWFESKRMPGRLLVKALRPFWHAIVREPYEQLRPVVEIAHVTIPMLVLHGRRDRQVLPHHAEALAAAGPTARLVLFNEGDHWNLAKQPGYVETITAFVEESLAAVGR